MNADADEAYLEHQASCRPGAAFRVRPEMDLDIAPLCKCHRAEWATVGPFSRVCADVTDQVRAVGKAGGARFTAVWPLSSVDPFMEHEAAAMLRRVATETALISLCQPSKIAHRLSQGSKRGLSCDAFFRHGREDRNQTVTGIRHQEDESLLRGLFGCAM